MKIYVKDINVSILSKNNEYVSKDIAINFTFEK